MNVNVQKRSGVIEPFDSTNIITSVSKSMKEVGQYDEGQLKKVASKVSKEVRAAYEDGDVVKIDDLHNLVENTMMNLKMYDTARAYITYRDQHKPNIFRKRSNIKPYEYPHLIEFGRAIQHSYWLFSEFSYTSDIQDVKVKMSPQNAQIVTRAMLSISQVENNVKTFWGDIGKHMPKPEIANVGAILSENEVRHQEAYSNLIELLGLNEQFKTIDQVEAIQNRIAYMNSANEKRFDSDPRNYFESIVLFSMFVENVSLFSQFLIIMSFNKHENMFKGMSNVIEATSLEEDLHSKFGFALVDIIKRENPSWWNDQLVDRIIAQAENALDAELKIIDWIYEDADSLVIPKHVVAEYIKYRLNLSLVGIGIDPIYEVNERLIEKCEWFEDEILTTKLGDFFNKRSVTYNKRSQAVDPQQLF